MATNPVPQNYEGVTPYLILENAAAAIDFYKNAFGAREVMRIAGPGGTVGHAELKIGGGIVMLAEACAQDGWKGPQSLGGSPVSLLIYVADVDATCQRAVDHGARIVRPVQDQFYGDRSGTLTDPFGHVWTVATHIEDVSPEEIKARMDKFMEGHAG
ncbi:MAG TPA: VOC family protein [Candidatus Krumholzibacteria bacterium]|nr:VOC family protein [Candidatus Krumholzibacteria bacterium]HPD72569.1 VOC family protein [Candidatus Krumholzibacteria bacterium]HRY40499.1 VOC family protein [Candidatus Krumholzibacteria bacterium]